MSEPSRAFVCRWCGWSCPCPSADNEDARGIVLAHVAEVHAALPEAMRAVETAMAIREESDE